MLVLLSAFDSGSRAPSFAPCPVLLSRLRALCLRLVATIILIGARLLPTFRPTAPFALTFAAAAAWAVYSVYSSRFSQGCDATAFFHGGCCCGLVDNLPRRRRARSCGGARLASVFALAGAAGCIASGYACWGHGMLKGDMAKMGIGSYAAPLLSVVASTIILA